MQTKPNHNVWSHVTTLIGKIPTPTHFPALRVSVREGRRGDRSYANSFSYTFGIVDNREDTEGKTFRQIAHIRDCDAVSYIGLLQDAATTVASFALKADKEAKGILSAPVISVAAMKPTNGTATKPEGNRASRREQARRAAVYNPDAETSRDST